MNQDSTRCAFVVTATAWLAASLIHYKVTPCVQNIYMAVLTVVTATAWLVADLIHYKVDLNRYRKRVGFQCQEIKM